VLLINAGVFIGFNTTAGIHECSLSSGPGVTAQPVGVLDRTDPREHVIATQPGHCHTNGALTVTAGTYTINLVLSGPAADSFYDDANLDVVFYPGGQLASALTLETSTEGEEGS